MANQNDGLFLLEVLIDKIVFVKSPCFSDKDFRTCVSIECPAVDPLEICDDDPGTCVAKSGGPFVKQFNLGKSCLFSLKESDIQAAMSKFPIKVTIFKSLPCGCLPTKIIMGECTIDMTKEFIDARNKFIKDPTTVSYQSLKDAFRFLGPDGTQTGEVVMFLRISCFGKLIVTRFQGSSAPPNLNSNASSGIVDRSCNPRKDVQTANDPCACGIARGRDSKSVGSMSGRGPCKSATGVCPIAGDPYNKMPCEDPDDPCYCSGPKPAIKPPMSCRNVDQYCLHIPKGSLLGLSKWREMTDEQKRAFKYANNQKGKLNGCSQESCFSNALIYSLYHASTGLDVNSIYHCQDFKSCRTPSGLSNLITNPSKCETIPIDHDFSFECIKKTMCRNHIQDSDLDDFKKQLRTERGLFGLNETAVYMTFLEEYCHRRNFGTQATASINKCFQVYGATNQTATTLYSSISNYYSTSTVSTAPYNNKGKNLKTMRFSDIYFFGSSKNKKKGMGPNDSKRSLCKSTQSSHGATKTNNVSSGSNTSTSFTPSNSKIMNTKRNQAAATKNQKSVSIKEDKPQGNSQQPCPSLGTTKGDMMVTIAHIKIGPKETCPIFGNQPCIGPKCKAASSGGEQGLVKVTTTNNPRRGVFEIVIRRLTGAPLAKNELMLEWTPPTSRPPPCATPCTIACWPLKPCRPSKCKLVVCRPPPCKPVCCKKRPCAQPFKIPCKPCPLPPCYPPPGCKVPCSAITCNTPCFSCCKSSPCLKLCPVGRRRPRRARSQPKIRSHPKHFSPCHNRSKTCPVVRCRSIPGCCNIPPFCLPQICYSTPACKPTKCCKRSCSWCCV